MIFTENAWETLEILEISFDGLLHFVVNIFIPVAKKCKNIIDYTLMPVRLKCKWRIRLFNPIGIKV